VDNAWFLLIRNANGQNLDVGVVKTPTHLLKFPEMALKFRKCMKIMVSTFAQ
jgi:hypothetical protein